MGGQQSKNNLSDNGRTRHHLTDQLPCMLRVSTVLTIVSLANLASAIAAIDSFVHSTSSLVAAAADAPSLAAMPINALQQPRRIIGGTAVSGTSYRWVGALTKLNGASTLCGVSIISKRYAISASHCTLDGAEDAQSGFSPVGIQGQTQVTMNCHNHDITSGNCTKLDVKRIIPHPCYEPSSMNDNDDLVMLEFYSDAPLAENELPWVDGQNGRLAETASSGYQSCIYNAGVSVKLLGWGNTNPNVEVEAPSNVLLAVDVPLQPQSKCRAAEPDVVEFNSYNINNILCIGGNAGKDSCVGDSGGPAVARCGDRDYLIGATVKGTQKPDKSDDCGVAGRYSVYTLVAKYHAFITTTLGGGSFVCSACGGGSNVWQSCTSEPAGVICTGTYITAVIRDDDSGQCTSDGIVPWVIVVIVLACIAVVGTVIAVVCWICRARERVRQRHPGNYVVDPEVGVQFSSPQPAWTTEVQAPPITKSSVAERRRSTANRSQRESVLALDSSHKTSPSRTGLGGVANVTDAKRSRRSSVSSRTNRREMNS